MWRLCICLLLPGLRLRPNTNSRNDWHLCGNKQLQYCCLKVCNKLCEKRWQLIYVLFDGSRFQFHFHFNFHLATQASRRMRSMLSGKYLSGLIVPDLTCSSWLYLSKYFFLHLWCMNSYKLN